MERRNTGWKVLTLILFIALLGTSGFITYDKVLKDKYFTKKDDKKEEKKETNNTTDKTADELYAEYLENLKENMSKTYQNMPADVDEFEFSKTHDALNYGSNTQCFHLEYSDVNRCVAIENGNLVLKVTEPGYNGKDEVAKNVVQYFVANVGQDSLHELVYITADGELYEVGLESLTDDKPTKTDLKNIVGIIPSGFGFMSGSHSIVFVDIEGNLFKTENGKAIQLNVE